MVEGIDFSEKSRHKFNLKCCLRDCKYVFYRIHSSIILNFVYYFGQPIADVSYELVNEFVHLGYMSIWGTYTCRGHYC